MRTFRLGLLFFALFSCVVAGAEAPEEGILNRLLAPGPLISGHKDLEKSDCLKCHLAGKGVPESKCLECHKDIRSFIENKSGFHGLNPKQCISCHSDHKGRAFDSTLVDQKTFDHRLTGFSLEGKHSNIRCSECHTDKRSQKVSRAGDLRYVGKLKTCNSCHKKDDIHHFAAPLSQKACSSCHGVKSWKTEIKFDHNRDTHYALKGKHEEVSCKQCHFPKGPTHPIYHWSTLKKDQCLSCHTSPHQGTLGPKFSGAKCQICHTEQSWRVSEFNHAKVTGYHLQGKHAELNCVDCHKQSPNTLKKGKSHFQWKGLKTQCSTCHADVHRFDSHLPSKTLRHSITNLKNCASCHTEQRWKPAQHFDHNQMTRFHLDGRHQMLSCNDCHNPKDRKPSSKSKSSIYFWPQLETKTCENCHTSPHTKTFSPKLLQKKCTECHVTSGWLDQPGGKKFDHATTTRFPLTGKHQGVSCKSCHVVNGKFVYKFPNSEDQFCVSCHKNIHVGQLSAANRVESCTLCHTTETFSKRLSFDHTKQAHYPLKGKHTELACEKCHLPSKEMFSELKPPKPKTQFLFPALARQNCATCHKDPHKGARGSACMECHDERSWKSTKDFHKNFALHGVHYSLQCAECHIGGRKLAGMSSNCKLCHQKDDIHQGTLPQCGECHRQQFWENAEWKHSLTRFPLQGAHRTLDCVSCHTRGIYRSTPNQCINCHINDALSASAPAPTHSLPAFSDCARCHNQFSF